MIDKIDITETIAKELSILINNNEIKTPEKAKQVAGELLRRGVQPTWRIIREILGTGSASTLQNAVNLYWSELGAHLDNLEKRPELPKNLVKDFNNLWDKALQISEKKLEKRLSDAFEKAKEIEITVNKEKEALSAQLLEANNCNIANENQLQSLQKDHHRQAEQLATTKKEHTLLESKLKENKQDFAQQIKDERNTHNERYTTLQESYYEIEKQKSQAQQTLANEKSQQSMVEKQNKQSLSDLKQDRQLELDRQAKQYDSMISHYASEISHFKTKLDKADALYSLENKKWQSHNEKSILTLADVQAQLMLMTQNNTRLEKEKTTQAQLLDKQLDDLQKINKHSVKLETRLEMLKKK
ncbi:MAG: DNA-binding protein [Thiotrichaceae bacterium]|nr:DNA-binding protein [Thiotrichaceae bacterium]